MSVQPFRRQNRRSRDSVKDENRLRATVENLSRGGPVRGNGLSAAGRAGSQLVSLARPEPIWVQVTGPLASFDRLEAYTQVTDDGGVWTPPADALVGSANFPAYVPPGWPDPAEGDVVLALPSAGEDGLILLTPAAPVEGTSGDPVTVNYGPYYTFNFVGPSVGMVIGGGTTLIVSGGGIWLFDVNVTFQGEACFEEFASWGAEWATLTASQNHDYAWDGSPWLRLATDAAATYELDGIAEPGGTCEGSELVLTNTGPGMIDVLDHTDAANGSVVANRIITPDGSTWTLETDDSAWLRYDRVLSRWRIIDRAPPPPAGGTVAFSGARVYHNADQTFGGSSGVLAFNSERYDTDSYHDPATNNTRLTVPTSGYYQIGGCVTFEVNGSGIDQLFVRVYLNGATSLVYAVAFTPATGLTVAVTLNVNTTYQLASGDYVELTVQLIHYSGTDGLKVLSIGNYTPDFWITKLGD